MTHRASAACDQYGPSHQYSRTQSLRSLGAHCEAAVGGQGGDAEAGTQLERGFVRQRYSVVLRQGQEFLSGPVGALPSRLP